MKNLAFAALATLTLSVAEVPAYAHHDFHSGFHGSSVAAGLGADDAGRLLRWVSRRVGVRGADDAGYVECSVVALYGEA